MTPPPPKANTPSVVEEIKAALEKATPGPWRVHGSSEFGWVSADEIFNGHIICEMPGDGNLSRAAWNAGNKDYIASCSPDRIRILLQLLEEAERAKAEAIEALRPFARLAELLSGEWKDLENITHLDADGDHDLMVEDLRRASSILESTR